MSSLALLLIGIGRFVTLWHVTLPCASVPAPGTVAARWAAPWWAGRWARARAGGRDRKSTRLNSSHLVISYAVFCLKKKKKQKHHHHNLLAIKIVHAGNRFYSRRMVSV